MWGTADQTDQTHYKARPENDVSITDNQHNDNVTRLHAHVTKRTRLKANVGLPQAVTLPHSNANNITVN